MPFSIQVTDEASVDKVTRTMQKQTRPRPLIVMQNQEANQFDVKKIEFHLAVKALFSGRIAKWFM